MYKYKKKQSKRGIPGWMIQGMSQGLLALWRMAKKVVRVLSFPVFSPHSYRHEASSRAMADGQDLVDEYEQSWWQRHKGVFRRVTVGMGLRVLAVPVVLLLSIGTIVFASVRAGRTGITQFPDGLRLYYESVEFSSDDGTVLRGWFIPSLHAEDIVAQGDKALRNKRPGVLLCHGIGGNRSQLLPLAAYLNRRGYEVLLFDFRACGLSAGQTRSFGIYEVNDALAAAHYLAGRATVDPQRIAALGLDLGGFAALGAAARDHSLRGAAVINVDADLRSAVWRRLGQDGLWGQMCASAYVWGLQSWFRSNEAQLSAVRQGQSLGEHQRLLALTSGSQGELQGAAARIVARSPAQALAVTVPDRALSPFINAMEMGPVLQKWLVETLELEETLDPTADEAADEKGS